MTLFAQIQFVNPWGGRRHQSPRRGRAAALTARLGLQALEARHLLSGASLGATSDFAVSQEAQAPTLTTTPGSSIVLGSTKLSDSATLSGGANPTGTITFYLFAPGVTPNAADSNSVFSDTLTVNGNGAYDTNGGTAPGGYMPAVIGTYQWLAVYSGDANNSSATSKFGDEAQVVVSPAAISTFEGGTITLGSGGKLYDSALLEGGINPTGTITFYLFAPGVSPNATDGNNVYSDTVAVSGNTTYDITMGTNPGGYLPTVTGTYQWVAVYSGDANNPPAASEFEDEPQTVKPPAPTITTTAGAAIVQGSGSKLTDSATLSGGATPTGALTFYLFAPGVTPNATDGNNVYSDTVSVNGDGTYDTSMGTNPGGYLPTAAGTYQWIAVYGGDANNHASASNFGDEPEIVAPPPLPPTITTTAGASVVLGSGTKLSDSATLSGGNSPTGTITFYLFAPGVAPSATDGNNVYSDTVAIHGDGTYDLSTGTDPGGLMPTAIGTYQWVAVYSGDANNSPVASAFGDEPEVVVSPPAISTFAGPSVVMGDGAKLTDSAILEGGVNPAGAITFYLFAPGVTPNATDSNNVYSDTVTVNGNLPYDTSTGTNPGGYLPTVTGTYQWVAVYSGDANNPPAASEFGGEPQIVGASPPPAQVVVFKAADQQTIAAGQTAGFTIKIMNEGVNTATGVTLSDVLPGGVASDVNWQIDASGAGFAAGTEPADFIIAGAVGHQTLSLAPSLSTLAAGASLSVHIIGQTSLNDVDPNLPPCTTALVNTATVNAANEPANQQNESSSATIVLQNVDVDVSKTADQATITAGQMAGFTIRIYNQGCVDATGLTLSDALPEGAGNDILWRIDPNLASGEFFALSGPLGQQQLELAPGVTTLQPGALISVHIIGQTTVNDVGALSNTSTVNASNEPPLEDNAQASSTVTIQQSPPNANPDELYVVAAIEQVLGRQPDQATVAYFVSALENGMSRLTFAVTLTTSDEYYDDQVRQAYEHFLGRAPDAAGLTFWNSQLRGGLTDEQMQAQFIGSPEYYQHSGGTDRSWVDQMYFDLLGRAPDSQGEASWVKALANGVPRVVVALGFATSPEREGIVVRDDYQTYLARQPSDSEVANWVSAFEHGLTNEDVVAGFIASDEYFREHADA